MNKTIKLAYDWYSPHFPLNNNQFSFTEAIAQAQNFDKDTFDVKIKNRLFPFRTMEIFKGLEQYEYVPTSTLVDNDLFLYEITVEMDEDNWIANPKIDILSYTNISNFVLDQIQTKNGYILIEVCHESPNVWQFFENIHTYFNSKNIPLNKVILLTGSSNATEFYKKFCDYKEMSGRRRMTVVGYEWFELLASRDIHLHPELQVTPNDSFYKIQKTFLCYNRRFKPHRTDLFVLFHKNGLLNKSFYSMPEIADDYSEITWKQNYRKEENSSDNRVRATKQLFKALYKLDDEEELNHINGHLPLRIDTRQTLKEMIQLVDNAQSLYDSSLISVVTESNFYNMDIFNTEKTFKAIANYHPFIIVGPPGSLASLKKLGYKTFEDFFNEDYDLITNDTARLISISKLCQEIDNWSWEKKRDFFHESTKITDYNYKLLKSIYYNKRNDFWLDFYNWHIK